MKIFVYGTLKKGYGNNALLKEAKFVREETIKGFKLFYAGFPVAAPSVDSSVQGEVYEIDPEGDTLKWLDRLEGNGRMYNRTVVSKEGEEVSLYVGHPEYWKFEHMDSCPQENNVYTWGR